MRKIQVFDWLKMPNSFSDDIAAFFEAPNDSYHRWYPGLDWTYPGAELKEKVNNWLLEQGMEIDENNKYFYVLIHISW
jgi:hypothetical protein